MSDMYFDVSEHIARFCPRSEVEEIDKFLARRQLKEFKLQDIRDLPNVTENAQPMLDKFVTGRLLKKLNRYYCPKHSEVALETTTLSTFRGKGSCQVFEESYPLLDSDTEVIYQLRKTPDTWSNCDASKAEDLVNHREPPLWRDRRLHIALISALIIALVAAAVALFIHFNPVNVPTPSHLVTMTTNAPTPTVNATSPSVAIDFPTRVVATTPIYPPTSIMTPFS